MMRNGARRFVLPLIGVATMFPALADAAIKVPTCPALAAWVGKFDANEKVALSQTNRNLWLHGLLLSKDTEQLFGQPALKWTAEDLAAADKQVVACWNEARRGGPARTAEVKSLEAFRGGAVRQFGGVLQVAATSDKRIDESLAALIAQPPSRDLMRALAAVGKAQGGAEGWAAANADLAGVPNGPSRQQAAILLVALRDGLTTSGERVFAPVAKRLDEVRPTAVAEAAAALATPPGTPEGLRALDALLTRTKTELGKSLSPADLASLDAAAATRRAAIEDEILAGETTKIAAVPPGLPGLAALQSLQASPIAAALSAPGVATLRQRAAERREALEDGMLAEETAKLAAVPVGPGGLAAVQAIQTGPVATALSPPRAATLRQRADERRGAIVVGIVDAQIALLDQFPTTVAGLRDLEVYRGNAVRALQTIAPAPEVARFAEAATARREALGSTIVDQQVAELDRFKGTLVGLSELESFRAGVVQALQQAGGSRNATRFIDAASARTDVLAREALPEFRSKLGSLPANEEGMNAFHALMTTIDPTFERMEKGLQAQYGELAKAKLAALEKGVAEEDARLQALPLPGATYADVERSGAKFEFRDDKRLHMTMGAMGTFESEYRVDADRVTIVQFMGAGSMVMFRRGAYLIDTPDLARAGIKLRREAGR